MIIQCGIYKITNTVDNNKVIIGQSINIKERWDIYRQKLRKGTFKNRYLQSAWKEFGEPNFKFEIELECTKEKLNEEEKRLIKEYNSTDRRFGYNIAPGGHSCSPSEETKNKISLALIGSKNPNYNKTMSEEQKIKISESVSKSMIGKIHSEETKRKISESLKKCGRIYFMSEEQKKKISESVKEYWKTKIHPALP